MKSKSNYALYCAIVVALGGFVFGFDAAVISGVVGFVSTEFNLTPLQIGAVVGAPTFSGMIATMFMGPLADMISRKKVLIIIAFIYLLSALASAFATSFEMLVAARSIGGIAFTSLMIAPMYIGEISPTNIRGKRVSINQMNIVIGFSAAYFANYFLLNFSASGSELATALGVDTNTWRWMLGLEILPAVVFFVALFFIPQSPRWLMLKNREDQARINLAKLQPEADIDLEISKYKQSSIGETNGFVTDLSRIFGTSLPGKGIGFVLGAIWSVLVFLFGSKLRLAVFVGVTLAIAQQITGINAIFFYAPTIFEQSGVGTNAAFAQAVLVGVINVIFTVVAMLLIDKWGRKPLLLVGLSGIALSMAMCAYGFSQAKYELTADSIVEIRKVENIEQDLDITKLQALVGTVYESDVEFKTALKQSIGVEAARDHESTLIKNSVSMNSAVILIGILGFVASFAISLGPVMWVMFSEIFPNAIRGVAISIVGTINSLVSLLVQVFFPLQLAKYGAAIIFGAFGTFAFIFLLVVIWVIPETKGKSLEELEAMFTKSKL